MLHHAVMDGDDLCRLDELLGVLVRRARLVRMNELAEVAA
jgi:hypothetical protein